MPISLSTSRKMDCVPKRKLRRTKKAVAKKLVTGWASEKDKLTRQQKT